MRGSDDDRIRGASVDEKLDEGQKSDERLRAQRIEARSNSEPFFARYISNSESMRDEEDYPVAI